MQKLNAKITSAKIAEVLSQGFGEFKKNPRVEPLFVFPTEVAKNSWIEWSVNSRSESGVDAVNTAQFIAWDRFKSEYIQPADGTKSCIPALVRKGFARKILKENEFKKLIASAEVGGDMVFAFTDWLSGILPSLALWKKHYENDYVPNLAAGVAADEENEDLLKLYGAYTALLEKCGFYEPSYAAVNFSNHKRKIYIFYPTILQDFSEYIDVLAASEDVTLVVLPEQRPAESAEATPDAADLEQGASAENVEATGGASNAASAGSGQAAPAPADYSAHCVNYPDARKELRRLALQLRRLIAGGTDLRRVAVNVPDLENIRPYIEREFKLYDIPFVIRTGIPYTQSCGGDIFGKIKGCIDSQCAPDALRGLLLDGFVPWRNAEMNLRLVRAGVKQRIVCPAAGAADVWLDSLAGKGEYKAERAYYEKLAAALAKFARAESFRSLKGAWAEFSREFIDEQKYRSSHKARLEALKKEAAAAKGAELQGKKAELAALETFIEENCAAYDLTDKILGRIITELSEFAEIEDDFNAKWPEQKLELGSRLDFFVNELEQKSYTPNEKRYGVNVFAYRTAACADFDFQFIVNANQTDITVPLKTLSFITDDEKRRLFGLARNAGAGYAIKLSEDASAEFVALYNAQHRRAQKRVFWSSAKRNFGGAAITHTALREFDTEKAREAAAKADAPDAPEEARAAAAFLQKLDSLDEGDFVKKPSPQGFTVLQKSGFEKWSERNAASSGESRLSEGLRKKIAARTAGADGFVKISASAMNGFYPCPKKWLFQNVMGIDDEKYSAKLAEANEIGNLYHAVLELMFRDLRGKRLPCYEEKDGSAVRAEVSKYLSRAIAAENAKDDARKSELFKSKLSAEVLGRQRSIIEGTLCRFVMQLCKRAREEGSPAGSYGGYKVEGTEMQLDFADGADKILFNGKIDLVLSCGEEDGAVQAVIVDYKTGAMPTAGESLADADGKIGNFQMAMYVKLLENAPAAMDERGARYKVQGGLFYSLKEGGKDFGFNYVVDAEKGRGGDKKVLRADFAPTEAAFMEYAKDFRDKLLACDFSAGAEYGAKNYVNPYSDCAKCRYKSGCRTTFNIGRTD